MSDGKMRVKKLTQDIIDNGDGGFALMAVVETHGETFETELCFETFSAAYDFYTYWWETGDVEFKEGDSE